MMGLAQIARTGAIVYRVVEDDTHVRGQDSPGLRQPISHRELGLRAGEVGEELDEVGFGYGSVNPARTLARPGANALITGQHSIFPLRLPSLARHTGAVVRSGLAPSTSI